ncbi:MAG: ABC transporter ATP-binding protein, partial [Clostridia bacterium]|nr:ABC transporter ATP-binding protein [Clostridia bacterium]
MKNKTFKRIENMIKPYRKTVIFVTILAIIIDVLALLKPYLVKVLIDNYLKNGINQDGFLSIQIIAFMYIA